MLTKPRTDCRGFSMIEVLVASSILTVIVMMLGMLFQSTGLAWRTGVQRADAFMQVRGFFGSVQRDLSAAIDASDLPSAIKKGPQTFNGSLAFYTLTGKGFDNSNPPKPYRSLTYVTYDDKGNREEYKLKVDGTWDKVSYNVMTSADRQLNPNKPQIKNVKFIAGPTDSTGFPLFVRIQATVTSSGYNLEIGAASAGPDGVWGTKDDIVTWTERK